MMDDRLHASPIQRVRHPLVVRRATVTRVVALTPRMKRIVTSGPDLKGFESPGFDDHIKLFLPADAFRLVLPVAGPTGLVFGEGATRPVMRDFTPRFFDPLTCELTIDIAIHEDGPATQWAAAVVPGQEVGIAGPRGSMLIPTAFHTHLLIGDEAALPAIARRLEQLPSTCRAVAFVEVGNAQEEIELNSDCDLTVRWVHRDRAGSTILDALKSLPVLLDDTFVWIACESAEAKKLRAYLVETREFDPKRVKATGYWRRGDSAVHDIHEI